MWKPEKKPKEPKGLIRKTRLSPIGKVGRQRQADRASKLAAEPADANGRRPCYICLNRFEEKGERGIKLEHIIDASMGEIIRRLGLTWAVLRRDQRNHGWACGPCNIGKKLGTLTEHQERRVAAAIARVVEALSN